MTSSYGVERSYDEIEAGYGEFNDSIRYYDSLEPERQQVEQMAVEQESATGQPSTEGEQQEQKPEQETKQPGDPGTNPNQPPAGQEDKYQFNEQAGEYEMKSGDAAMMALEGVLAPPTGMLDGFTDLYNWFTPGPDIPKIPQFKDKGAQGVRDISSIIGPMFTGIGALGNGARSLHAAGKIGLFGRSFKIPKLAQAIGNNPIFKFFAKHGLEGGVGVAVDVSNKNSEGENVQRQIREFLGTEEGQKTLGIFPEHWATGSGDSPDEKRHKNAMEGFGLGIISGIAEGMYLIGKGIKDTNAATKYVPKDEVAEEFFNNFKNPDAEKLSDDPITDRVLKAQRRQEAAMDEIGEYFINKKNEANLDEGLPYQTADEIQFDEPVKGIHTSFDFTENAVRTVDPDGVVGVAVDAVRVQKDIGTRYGRLGSMVSEAALKYGLDGDNLTKRKVVLAVKKHITESGKFDALVQGRTITDKEIDEAGTFLAEVMAEMDPGMMRELLDDYRKMDDTLQFEVVNTVGYDAVFKAFKHYREEFLNMTEKKAQAYLTTSLAGQASDMAGQLPNLEGTAAIDAAREMIFDRMEYLMVEKGLAARDAGATLRALNVWDRMKRLANPGKAAKEFVAEEAEAKAKYLKDLVADSKRWIGQLRTIAKEKPNYLKPLYEMYDATDGSLKTMYDLNRYVRANLSDLTKAFIDGNPEIPNHLVQGFWTNYYHSILSAFATPLAALVGNTGGLISRPIASMAGALLSGDLPAMKRMFHQYAGFSDAVVNGFKHGWDVWKRSEKNPRVVQQYGRQDLVMKNEENLQVLQSFADAAMKEGNDGPAILLEHVKAQHDWAANPMVAFSARAMTAYDAFTKAMIATAEARGNAFDTVLSKRSLGKKVSKKKWRKIRENEYNQLFNEHGFVREDSAADFYGREIALNLDSVVSNSINEVARRYPIIKPWFLFPRTQVNMVGMFMNYGPTKFFAKDWYDLTTPGVPMSQVSAEHISKVLTQKGINVDANAYNTFRQMRYEAKGRVAIGTGLIMTAAYAFMNDRIRGDGHYNYQTQKVRESLGWEPRTYKGLDGKWHTYKHLGPAADWLAATVNVMDNFDSIQVADTEKLLNKLSFIMATTITNRSVMSQVKPLNDILNGQGSAANRWVGTFLNGAAPAAGLRSQFSRIMSEGMREFDDDVISNIRNRNNYLDPVDKTGALPHKYNYIDGEIVGSDQGFWARAASNLLGYPVGDKMTPNREFLIDIEYDSQPVMRNADDGVELTADERSFLYSAIGKDGYFAKELTRIRKMAGPNWRDNAAEARNRGITSEQADIGKTKIYLQIDRALMIAKKRAMGDLRQWQEQQQTANGLSARERSARQTAQDSFNGLSYY